MQIMCKMLVAAVMAIALLPCGATSSPAPKDYHVSSQVLYPFKKAALFVDTTLQDALQQDLLTNTAAAVLVVSGAARPSRRRESRDILSFSPAAAEAIPEAVRFTLAAGLHQVEVLRGVRLFPITLDIMPQADSTVQGAQPWVVFELSSGKLLLRQQLVQLLQSTPVQALSVLADACLSSMQHLLEQLNQGVPVSTLNQLTALLSSSMAAGAALAFAAAIPKWFCFVCPIVLGLLSPLVINAGVGAAANEACKVMQLPDDECVDLWFTALALGMILALLSAIPIFKVCRMYECAHPNGTSTAVV